MQKGTSLYEPGKDGSDRLLCAPTPRLAPGTELHALGGNGSDEEINNIFLDFCNSWTATGAEINN